MTTQQPPAASNASGFLSRIGALLADLLLLGAFLAAATSVLQVLISVVVLVVGYAQHANDRFGMIESDWPARHREDWLVLGGSILASVLLILFHRLFLRVRRRLLARFVESRFESFVSKRYLLAREGGSLVSLIAVVSVSGVAVGVMALVVVMSVMNGFDRVLLAKIMGVISHVEISPTFGGDRTISWSEVEYLMETVEANPEVVAAAPLFVRQTLFQRDTGGSEFKAGGLIRGIDFDREAKVSDLMANVPAPGAARPGFREIVLGIQLARTLRVGPGDDVYVLGKVVTTANGTYPRLSRLKVVGLLRTGLYDVDNGIGYVSMETAQNIFVDEGAATSVHVKLRKPEDVDLVARQLAATITRGNYQLVTWQQRNSDFFNALWVEKVAMFIILMLIVLVAAFNIVGTLVMTVVQKTREIGILKSMGAPSGAVMRIFLSHGFFIGLIGTALGVSWGLWICLFVHNDIDKIFRLPSGVYGLERLPVLVEPSVVLFIAGCAMVVCLLASIIPARRAARFDPVEALRHE
ncbi:MAG: ABC transporter permease [Candidatus Sumerlaeia bacterium]|nr:ABC transporter permease [Candidatus Sumerlaeia bacterium]